MSLKVYDGKYDVLISASPRVFRWPSIGVKTLSRLCAQGSLKVGVIGDMGLTPKGVLPFPTTGGLLLAEDIQGRIHRLHSRAIIRVTSDLSLPDPFLGWRSEAVLPYSTARYLLEEGRLTWNPSTVIFGTGNKALRLGSMLLENETSTEVFCLETLGKWEKKSYSGWEVEKRRFEVLGGKIIYGQPLSIMRKSALLWELRVQDLKGVRVIELARAISVGPYTEIPGIREYPPGSYLFEMDQTSLQQKEEDPEGWDLEEERGRWLALKILRELSLEQENKPGDLPQIFRKSRVHLRGFEKHYHTPFVWSFEKKWLNSQSKKRLMDFEGVPQKSYQQKPVASLECFESIQCNACESACPENAIKINRSASPDRSFLIEEKCTGCGDCLLACPSRAISLVYDREDKSQSEITLPVFGKKVFEKSQLVSLLNRRGEKLGVGRVESVLSKFYNKKKLQLVNVQVPQHLLWEARGINYENISSFFDHDESYVFSPVQNIENETVEVSLDGEKRLLRKNNKLSVSLFEIGQSRPEDALLCEDGSCGLCELSIDGVKQLACQTKARKGMFILTKEKQLFSDKKVETNSSELCPCMGVSVEEVVQKIKNGKLKSPEALLIGIQVGKGQCHGQRCMGALKRLLLKNGIHEPQWIDWRFPWLDWVIRPK